MTQINVHLVTCTVNYMSSDDPELLLDVCCAPINIDPQCSWARRWRTSAHIKLLVRLVCTDLIFVRRNKLRERKIIHRGIAGLENHFKFERNFVSSESL